MSMARDSAAFWLVRQLMTTRARWSAAAFTSAAPSPRAPPVTRKTLPLSDVPSSLRCIDTSTGCRLEPDRLAPDPSVRPHFDLRDEAIAPLGRHRLVRLQTGHA